jgi:hypothetical protein
VRFHQRRRIPSDIPVGTQLSPSLIRLPDFLAAISRHSGDRAAIQAAIWKPPVHRKRAGVPKSHRTANLPLEAAVQYGLLERRTLEASSLAKDLANLTGAALYDAFARHILLNCNGLRVVEAVEQMQADRRAGLSSADVTADSLARNLSAQGFRVTEHNTAINSMRMWLAEAGLFSPRGWDVDAAVKERLIGLPDETVAVLAGFSLAQRAFTDALCRIDPTDWCSAAEVRDLAEATYGVRLGRASLPKEVLEPLKQSGLIQYETRGTRGGKAARLKTTATFRKDVLQPFITLAVKTLDPVVTKYYQMRPADIYAALDSSDKFKKGQALEAYVIHVMRLLRLRFVEWRKRGPETGGAEIDATFQGLVGGLPTVWQVQCKNVPSGHVRLEDVAKEVGQVPTTRTTHILIIANGRITADAEQFAMETMRSSPVTIFLLGKKDFEAIKAEPGALAAILRRKAEEIVRNRTGQA